MAFSRNRPKKALYEVVNKAMLNSRRSKPLETLHPELEQKVDPGGNDIVEVNDNSINWPSRPRPVVFNAGRIEISMPLPVAVVLVLAIVLIGLMAFRLGQGYPAAVADTAAESTDLAQQDAGQRPIEELFSESVTPVAKGVTKSDTLKKPSDVTKGDNRIVIQTWHERAQLEPVKNYFAENGIKTEIRNISGMYYLVTAEKYQNPQRSGTNGFIARKKIIDLGARYKAPIGYGTFGTKPFNDAYGMKFKD